MRIVMLTSLVAALAGSMVGMAPTPAEAQRYRVICVAPGAPACRTSCGSNKYTVACYAYVRNGRCFRHCGRVR